MQDVEAYGIVGSEKKRSMFLSRIMAYLAILLTMLAFIFSCIGLNMGRQSNLEKTLYTFSFPYFNQIPKVESGMVVSLDSKGYVFTGAGTTISRNVTVADVYGLDDIRVCAWSTNVIFTGSVGRLVGYEISYDDISIENAEYRLPTVGSSEREVSSLFKLDDETLAVVGSGEILPVTVKVTERSSTDYKVEWTPGTAAKFTEFGKEAYPYCDNLPDDKGKDMLACTYEEGDNLYTRIFKLSGQGSSKTFTMSKAVQYGVRRKYHGLAGLGPDGYVVAAVGPMFNETFEVGPIRLAFVKVDGDNVHVSRFTDYPHEMTTGYFSLDNLYRNGAVMCYTRLASGGIDCVSMDISFDMGPHGNGIQFGSTLTVSSGGSAIDEARTKLQIINQDTFALMWADQNIGGAISYQMVTFNNAGDMVKNGPTYVVSHFGRFHEVTKHIIGCSGIDNYKSAIVELVQSDGVSRAYLHTVYVYPRPIGIAAKSFSGGNQVQFGGLWKVKSSVLKNLKQGKLVPGWMYYTNDRGMILPGGPAGYMHNDFGVFYVTSRDDDSLLGLHNQIGMAISESEILIRLN